MTTPTINIDQLRLDAQEFARQHHQPSDKMFLARWRYMVCLVLDAVGLRRRDIARLVSDDNQTLSESTVGYNIYKRHSDDYEVYWIETLIGRHLEPLKEQIRNKPKPDMKRADKVYHDLTVEERYHILRKVDMEYHETTQAQIKALQDEVIDLKATNRSLEIMLDRALVNRKRA